MITIPAAAKLGAMAAAVAAPAILLVGTGTAQAFDIHIPLAVWGTSAPGGVDVHVQTPIDGLSGWCTYTSIAQGNPIGKPLPAIGVPFYLGPVGDVNEASLWFPAWPTGSTWDTTVSCPNGTMTVTSAW
ncbi:MAG TPA: hypothetical protein PKI02_05050 [Mycobacterium sp.]|nr:hypothetical protein [Mycobacterium sp.]